MASHHHLYPAGHHPPPPPSPPPAACCTPCCCFCPYSAAAAPPPSSSSSDHLLHAIVANLLLNNHPHAPPPAIPYAAPPPSGPYAVPSPASHYPAPPPASHYPAPPPASHYAVPPPAGHYAAPPPPPPPATAYRHHHHGYYPSPPKPQPEHTLLLRSLLRRVADLEAALPHLSEPPRRRHHAAFPRPPPPAPPPPPRRPPSRAAPIEERAARTIQAEFRRFLARRSLTLRQLKQLAVVNSRVTELKASLSGRRAAADPTAVSDRAMELLLQLDAIQGVDPMIHEGKRAMSRELTRILEFADKVLVAEEAAALRASEIVDEGGILAPTSKAKKRVSFLGEEEENEEARFSGEAMGRRKGGDRHQLPNGNPGLAPPPPVTMEPRAAAAAAAHGSHCASSRGD